MAADDRLRVDREVLFQKGAVYAPEIKRVGEVFTALPVRLRQRRVLGIQAAIDVVTDDECAPG